MIHEDEKTVIMKTIKYVVMECEMIMCQQGFVITGEQDKTVVGLQMAMPLVILRSGHHGSAALVVVDMGNVEILARHVREIGWIGRERRIISK